MMKSFALPVLPSVGKLILLIPLLGGLLSGCAIVTARSNEFPKAQVRDVPFAAREQDASLRKRIMVLPFIDREGRTDSAMAVAAREAFIRAMRTSGDFVFVSTTDFPKDPASFFKNNRYELETMGKLAGGVGLTSVIEGRITEIRARRMGDAVGIVRKVRAKVDATVGLRMVNAKNGNVIFDETRSAEIEDAVVRVAERSATDRNLENDPQLIDAVVTKAFESATTKIAQTLEKLSWEGRVALVKGERIYLNAGRISGIQVGDILKITEDGQDVYDPDNGALIGRVPGRLKGTVEVVSYFGKDGSVGIVHSGSGFRENDRVEVY